MHRELADHRLAGAGRARRRAPTSRARAPCTRRPGTGRARTGSRPRSRVSTAAGPPARGGVALARRTRTCVQSIRSCRTRSARAAPGSGRRSRRRRRPAGSSARSAAFRRALRRSCTIATWTATSYSITIGIAIAHMVNGSVLGVATAANRKIRKMAIRRGLAQHPGRQDAGEVRHDDDQRHLERGAEDDQRQRDERDVVVDRQLRLGAEPGLLEQDPQALRQDHVGQRHAGGEQHRGRGDERERVLALVLAQPGGDERPDLVQPERRR